jgi:hypothetical protein
MAMPSYFSGDTQRVLEERRRLRPQRAARRVMRGLSAGVVGATEGVSAASDYVAANPLDDYEKRRAQFLEMTAAALPYVELGTQREQYIRQDTRARILAELDAMIQATRIEADLARTNAELSLRLQLKELEVELTREQRLLEELTYGSMEGRQLTNQLQTDMETQAERLEEQSLLGGGGTGTGTAVRNANGDVVGTMDAGSWTDNAFAYYDLWAQSRNTGEPALLIHGAGQDNADAQDVFGSNTENKLLLSLLYNQYARSNPQAAAGDQAAVLQTLQTAAAGKGVDLSGLGVEDLAEARNYRPRVVEPDPDNLPGWVPGSTTAGTGAGTGTGSRGRPYLATENFAELVRLPEDVVDGMDLDPNLRREVQQARYNNYIQAVDSLTRVAQLPQDAPHKTVHDIYVNAERLGTQIGVDPEVLYNAVVYSGEVPGLVQGEAPSYADIRTQGEAYAARETQRQTQTINQITQNAPQAGADTTSFQERGAEIARMGDPAYAFTPEAARRAGLEPTPAPESAEPTPAPESAEPTPAPAGNAIEQADQQIQQDRQQQEAQTAQQAQEQQRQAENGTAMFYGIEVPADRLPTNQGEKIELMFDLLREYPSHPPLQQTANDLMRSPDFARWMEARGYGREPTQWHLREFEREYRYQRRMNLQRDKAQRRLNIRAGVTPDDSQYSLPETPDEGRVRTGEQAVAYGSQVRRAARGIERAVEQEARDEERKRKQRLRQQRRTDRAERQEERAAGRPDPTEAQTVQPTMRERAARIAQDMRARRNAG